MSNPIPLSSPDGVLYGYACGNCHQIVSTYSLLSGRTEATTKEYTDSCAALNRQDADDCCRCSICKIVKERSYDGICDDCRPAREAELEAAHAAYALEDAPKKAQRDAALAKANDKDAAQMLRKLMSDISEEHYCAGWLGGLEYDLWAMLNGTRGYEYGNGEVAEFMIDELQRLSEKSGGWWVCDNEIGNKFVTIEEWLELVFLDWKSGARDE